MVQHDTDEHLSRIPTQWSLVFAAHGSDRTAALEALVARYGGAIERYLAALVRWYNIPPNEDLVGELCQQFYFKLTRGDLRNARPQQGQEGRFRFYVKTTLRNLVRDYARNLASRQKQAGPLPSDNQLPDSAPCEGSEEPVFEEDWKRVMLDEVWRTLQARHPRLYAVLWMAMKEDLDAKAIAERLGERPDWVRQNKKRARDKFAELLLLEATQTLDSPTPEQLRDELGQLRLAGYYDDAALEKAAKTLNRRR
jgi:RNA polymerase sigma factor (sigma-70 family)